MTTEFQANSFGVAGEKPVVVDGYNGEALNRALDSLKIHREEEDCESEKNGHSGE